MPQRNSSTESDSEDTKYFKTRLTGLEVVVGDPDQSKGEVAPKTVAFVPYWVLVPGEEGPGPRKEVKFGFLKTDDGSALKKLENDTNVTEIDKDEFEEATVVREDDAGQQIGGFRAPY